MTYTMTKNAEFGSLEITFDGKPAQAVRDALKALRFRWHGVRRVWYGYADEQTTREALDGVNVGGTVPAKDQSRKQNSPSEEKPVDLSEFGGKTCAGYMGATAWKGSKSDRFLHGAELAAAVRADLKKIGVKGVSIRSKTYAGGQSLTVAATFTPSDIVPLDDFIARYEITGSGWIYTEEHRAGIWSEEYYNANATEQKAIREAAARYEHKRYSESESNINEYHIRSYRAFTEAFLKKLELVKLVLDSYRYDDSNSMVDYFDTNFYYNIYTKPAN